MSQLEAIQTKYPESPIVEVLLDQTPFMVVKYHDVHGQLAEDTFEIMKGAMSELDALTVDRHAFTHDEWLSYMADARVITGILFQGDTPLGGITGIYDLDAAPWVSRTYLEHKFPGRCVMYQPDTFVAPEAQRTGKVTMLFEAAFKVARQDQAIAVFAVCDYNVSWGYMDFAQMMSMEHCGGVIGEIDTRHIYALDASALDAPDTAWMPDNPPFLQA